MTVIDEKLEIIFQRYIEQPFLLVRPGGNWGDELIYWGARSLLERLAISYQEVEWREYLGMTTGPETVVYLHGSGGINPYSKGTAASIISHAAKHHKGVVIQGPQTCCDDIEFVKSELVHCMSRSPSYPFYFFSRETTTFEVLKAILPSNLFIGLADDTAFLLSSQAIQKRIGRIEKRYDLLAARADNETARKQPPSSNSEVNIDPAYFATTFDHWLRLHAAAKRIVTNRTHSSILGAILGTPTTLYAGRYHKNRSIWEYSLRTRGVEWLDDRDLQIKPETLDIGTNRLRDRIGRSWKVQRFGKWLQGVPLS